MKSLTLHVFLIASPWIALSYYSWAGETTRGGGVAPYGFKLIEGDILVRTNFSGAKATTIRAGLWPNGVVPYEFDANVTAINRNAMLVSMADWQNNAHISFTPRSGEANYVHIQNGSGNNSEIGVQGGIQFINITNWNYEFIMCHELGHCLGFWHEQSRADRLAYVQINFGNIASSPECGGDCSPQFGIHDEANHYGPYDFDSVMHYGPYAFSANGLPTITVLPPNDTQWQAVIGQRSHLSTMDKLTMSYLYPASNWVFADVNFPGGLQNGTFLNPYITLGAGVSGVPNGGTVYLEPGNYPAIGKYSKPMIIKAALSPIILGN